MKKDSNKIERRRVLQTLGISAIGFSVPTGMATAEENSTTKRTIKFEALTKEGKRIFRKALHTGKYTSREPLTDRMFENDFVDYQGDIYSINRRIQHLNRERISPTSKSNVPDEVSVRSFADLSAASKRAFVTAVQQGGHTFEGGAYSFDSAEGYVEYQDTVYWLGHSYLNIPEYSIAPEQV